MADTMKILNCPACGKEMKKVYMDDQAINVDICLDGCGGILFDNRELEKCDEPHENDYQILEAIQNKTFTAVDETGSRTCPVCETSMMKMGAASGKVQLDVCAVCGAKFLDNGELQKIRNCEKNEIDSCVLDLIDKTLEESFNEITHGAKPGKGSPRRQFVENIVRKYLFR